MDIHLDRLLNLADVTVESCLQEAPEVFLKLRFLQEESNCRYCNHPSDQLNQNRPVLIRDISIFGQPVYLQVPRRQFYCRTCQKYFTESLSFVDWERRYTQRYENYIYQRVQATTIEQVSREEDLSWDQVQGIFNHRFNHSKKQTGERLLV
jgi:transposase